MLAMKGIQSINKLSFIGPVTALAFARADLLFAGCGTTLAIYNWKSGELLKKINLFKRSKIQGIEVGSTGMLLVWGAYSFSFVPLVSILDDYKTKEYVMEDWLMAGLWAHDGHPYLFTAHNLLLRISKDLNSLESVSAKSVECILYSAAIFSNQDDVIVAAGTVFGEIEVWSAKGKSKAITLRGHEGSIFDVSFSNDGSKLISCSDDRSIRVWDLSTEKCVAIGWGHLARIWKVEFLSDGSTISTGEDSTTRIWICSDGKLQCEQIWEGHSGKNIWSLAVCSAEVGIVATGGADGAIRLWDISAKRSQWDSRKLIAFSDICRGVGMQCGDVKQYTTVDKTSYAFSTVLGYIILFQPSKSAWSILYYNKNLAGYSVLRGFHDERYVCVGDRHGALYIVGSGDCEEHIILNPPAERSSKVLVIATLSSNSHLFILAQFRDLSLPWAFFAVRKQNLELDYSIQLTPPATFQIASACLHPSNQHIIVGSRFGALALYNISSCDVPVDAVNCWRRIVSDDAITSLSIAPSADDICDILVTSRSGSYAVCNISLASNGEQVLEKIHLGRLAKGDIEGAAYMDFGLVLWGFRSNYFFVWNETLQQEIFSEVCGGVHRHWDFRISSSSSFDFMYTKSTSLSWISVNTSKLRNKTPQNGMHGREIRAVSISSVQSDSKSILVASGAEDTCIRISRIYRDSTLKTICVLRRHVSGIQEIQWSPNGRYLFSSAAREEFTVWKVTSRGQSVYLYPLVSAPIESAMPDLRVMDFAVHEYVSEGITFYFLVSVYSDSAIRVWLFNTKSGNFRLVSVGRYKTCCIFKAEKIYDSSNGKLYLIAGSSDGHITGYDMSGLLQAVLLGTEFSEFPLPSWSIPVHQSSVRSLCLVNGAEKDHCNLTRTLIVTGGDDNGISVTDFIGGSFELVRRINLTPSAHSSTITSISELQDGMIVSTAVDQRVRIWNVSKEAPAILTLINNEYTSVSDTGCSAVLSLEGLKTLLIGGAGLDIWTAE